VTSPTARGALERIACFERDLVVQAGAGTGKTHALVTLWLHLIAGATATRQRRAPARVAVVTFTEKAAGELKERMRVRLGALAAAPSEIARLEPTLSAELAKFGQTVPDAAALSEALVQLGSAPIGTFHSFCATLLRRHAARAAIDPEFSLLDDADALARVTQVAERTVLDALNAGDDDVEELVAEYGWHGVGRGTGLIEQLVALRAIRAEEGQTYAGLADNYEAARLVAELERATAALHSGAARLLAVAPDLGGKSTARAYALAEAARTLDFDSPAAIEGFKRELGWLRKADSVKQAIDQACEQIADARASLRAAPLAQAFARLCGECDARYREQKRRAGVVDFADLLVLARDLLRDDAQVRAAVRGRFDALLVDEFQDTNPVQAELVELIGSRQPDDALARLFVVGDRKQSIYEFRGADVAVFARAAGNMLARGGNEELLKQSRRSAPSVLAFTNALFALAMAGGGRGDWDVSYEPQRDDLDPFRREPDVPAEVVGGWTGAELLVVQPGVGAQSRAREARSIARRIRQLQGDGRRFGDMAILLRRFTHLGDYLDALRAAQVPYFVVRGRGFFAAQEVRDLASALTVLDNPDDGLALVALLRSSIVGLSDESLTRLAIEGQLRTRILLDPATQLPALPTPEADRLLKFRALFRELRLTADRLGPAACAQAIVDAADLTAVLAATPDGEQRVANLQRLVERARELESAGQGLRHFANWLRRAAAPGGEAEAAQAQVADERDDVVRVMTVHQSKGLEFPVVFVPACGGIERADAMPVLYDAEEGLGFKIRDPHLPSGRVHTTASRRVWATRRARQRAESLRLFYVASTRARDLVVFSGEQLRKTPTSWRAQLDALLATAEGSTLLRVVAGDALPAPAASLSVGVSPSDGAMVERQFQRAIQPRKLRPETVTVAVTQLADFALCPRRYHQFHGLGLMEHPASARAASSAAMLDFDDGAVPLDPLRRGTLAHRLLERVVFAPDGPDMGELDRLLAADGYNPADPEVAEVRAHVARFLATSFARGLAGAPARRELPFLLAVPYDEGVLYLRGQIDLLLLSAEGVTVIDFKHARAGDLEDYRFQLDAYALAARRLYPQAPSVSTGLAFLKEADPTPAVACVANSGQFERELANLGRQLADARASESWESRPLSTCHRIRCGFIYRCYPTER
jgi:ATP-dependent exoDNAse (exonuclease V) beta subunit